MNTPMLAPRLPGWHGLYFTPNVTAQEAEALRVALEGPATAPSMWELYPVEMEAMRARKARHGVDPTDAPTPRNVATP